MPSFSTFVSYPELMGRFWSVEAAETTHLWVTRNTEELKVFALNKFLEYRVCCQAYTMTEFLEGVA